MRKNKLHIKGVFLVLIALLLSRTALAERVPASAIKDYPKEKEGLFESQGFGEDFPKASVKRAPASEGQKKFDKDGNEILEDPATVKLKEDLENELQLQRRVDVFYEGRVRFKNGAAIWATEDPGASSPKLEITSPEEVDPTSGSVQFRVFSNYLPFIKKWELRIFKKEKLQPEVAVKTLSGGPDSLYDIKYEFEEDEYKEGDALYYQLKVFKDDKIFDVVNIKKLIFVKRVDNQNLTEGNDLAESDAIAKIWGQSSIEKQNIPIRGSRVRLVGNNIPRDHLITYRGQSLRVDENGKFVVEEHFPIGKHRIEVDIQDQSMQKSFTVPFDIEVTGKYFFMVGIADLRVGQTKLSEKISGLSDSSEFDDDVFVDGRLAYFLKGRIQGKYLITSQLDTTEGDISEIFKGLHRKNSESLFRRLDPDRYYPVYGDNSTTREEAPSLGKFYVKVEVDKSYALWGNANLALTGTLFSQYNRTLYGGHFNYQTRAQTKYGDDVTKVTAFVAEPETLLGHNEFLGTGGRVYSLRHNDVVQGSEKMVIEVRDRDSGLIKGQVVLKPNQDYEFDFLAGRVVLNQPLTVFVNQAADEVIDPNGTGNDRYYLIVDYEYNDTGEGLDNLSFGGRAQHWINDRFAIAGTYVEEKRENTEYNLSGVDATWKMGQESFLKVETSETKNIQTEANFESLDGGLSFEQKPFVSSGNSGRARAWGAESQIFLNDFVNSKNQGVLSTWYRNLEGGFSTARRQSQNDLQEYGYDLEFNFGERDVLKSKMTFSKEKTGADRSSLISSYGHKFLRGSAVSLEYRIDNSETPTVQKEEGQLAGLRYSQRITSGWSAYVKGQTTVAQKGGYENNDRAAIGSKFRISRKWDGNAEYSDGDRGSAAVAGLSYNLAQGHQVYANLDKSVDSASGPLSNGVTLGQRKTFKNGVRLTTENQFQETAEEAGINQLYGLDYNLNRLLALNFSYQIGELENEETGLITEKNSIGAGLVYTKDTDVTASTKVSVIRDRGDRNVDQLLLTNSLKFKNGPGQTWFFEADYLLSENPTEPVEDNRVLSRYTEANVGYAFRPVSNDRFNLFARYTYLYDLDSQAQENARNDQRVNIVSVEGSYDLNRKWELGIRLAQKIGSERAQRNSGLWFDTTLSFAQTRLRYHLIKKIDGVFEYRLVDIKESQDLQTGFLLGLDYHLGHNFKIGAGYNFTDFNDDLTNFNFNSSGWFFNVVGKL